jgi:hypothetical protein
VLLTLALPSGALDLGCLVTFLLSVLVTNHDLLSFRLYCAKVVNSTRLYSGGLSRLPGNPNRNPPPPEKNLKADSFHNMAWPWPVPRTMCPRNSLLNLCSFVTSSIRLNSSTSPSATACTLQFFKETSYDCFISHYLS